MSDDPNDPQPSGREPALSEESVPRTGNEPALSFDHLLPGLRDGLTAEDREARLRALQAAFDKPEKSIHLLRVLLDAEYDPRTRQRAAAALGQIGDAQSVPALLEIIDDPNPSVQRVAIWALGQIGSEDAHSSLIDKFEAETDPGIRHLLIEALGSCTAVRLVPLLIQFRAAYEEGHKSHRLSSDLLSHIASEGDYDQLTTLIDHNNQDVQQWAAEVVAERCPPVVENIPVLLKCAELGAPSPAFDVIARIDDDSIWEIFSQYLHDDRDEVCRAMLRELGRMGTERSAAMLIEFLHTDKREDLLVFALNWLQSSGGFDHQSLSSELTTVLIDLYKTVSDYFQLYLVNCFALIDNERAFTQLQTLCQKSEDLAIRHRALIYLYPKFQPSMLLELLCDEEPIIRQLAALYVYRLNEQQAFSKHDYDALRESIRSRLVDEKDVDTRLTYIMVLLEEDRSTQLLEMAYQGLYKVSYDFCDEYPEIIRSLFEHLMSNDSPLQTKALDLARSHPASELRSEFILALSHLDDERVIGLILERLHSDSDADIRSLCASILDEYPPSPAIIEALVEALNDDGSRFPVCRAAASTLRYIGTPEALAAVEAWERSRSQQ